MEELGASTSEIRRLNAGRVNRPPGSAANRPAKQQKQQYERMARMAKNDLLDAIFQHFRDRTHWSIKELRQKVQQPETYLREVLNEVAILERSGPNNGMYRLTDNYATQTLEQMDEDDEIQEVKPHYSQLYKMEPQGFDYGAPDLEGDDDDDDDDEDEDMVDVLE